MRYASLLALALFLAGCAAHDAQINPMLNSMSSVNQAIQAFGPPMQVSDMHDGAKLYVWASSRNAQVGGIPVYQPNTQTHTGTIYSPSGGYAGTYTGQSYGGSVTYTPVQNLNFSCTLQVIVEQNGNIRTWSYQGNACDSLIVGAVTPAPSAQGPGGVDASGNAMGLNPCLEAKTRELAKQYKDIETVAQMAESQCYESTGGKIPNLTMYYARQAIENSR